VLRLSSSAIASCLAAAALAGPTGPASAGEWIQLPSRGEATQGIYLSAPASPPTWVVVLLPGGNGAIQLSDRGAKNGGNFLVRTASYWNDAGDVSVLFDTPSDHADGMPDSFRLGKLTLQDVAATVTELRKRYPLAKVALVGTSRGTITLGNVLKRTPAVADAYVLTSPVTLEANSKQPGLAGMSWPGNKARVLVLSNEHDGCRVSPFDAAKSMAADNGFDFIAVSSSESKGRGGECGPSSPHGFLGIETKTLDAIRAWLEK
jgi:alpha-beta hydrolase superfamily lysophospholipase